MELKEILAVAGQPGLWRFVAQGTRGVIVESLTEGRRMVVPANARVSGMTDITVFTTGEDRPLSEIFAALFAALDGAPSVGHKEPESAITAAFAAAVPDYDPDRVHTSDMRKIIQWYNLLVAAGYNPAE